MIIINYQPIFIQWWSSQPIFGGSFSQLPLVPGAKAQAELSEVTEIWGLMAGRGADVKRNDQLKWFVDGE